MYELYCGHGMLDPCNPVDRAPGLEIHSADLDHWADIRDLHAFSFTRLTGPFIDARQCAMFLARTREPEYTQVLQDHHLLVAGIDGHLVVGTAGWIALDSLGATARITSVCVSPLFAGLGIGRRLVEASEADAWRAGHRDFATHALPPSVGFFETLGYMRSSEDVQALSLQCDLPVIVMRKSSTSIDTEGRNIEQMASARALQRR